MNLGIRKRQEDTIVYRDGRNNVELHDLFRYLLVSLVQL